MRGIKKHYSVLVSSAKNEYVLAEMEKKKNKRKLKRREIIPNFLSSFRDRHIDTVQGHSLQFMAVVLVHPLGLSSVQVTFPDDINNYEQRLPSGSVNPEHLILLGINPEE